MHSLLLRRATVHDIKSFAPVITSLHVSSKLQRAGFIPPYYHSFRRQQSTMSTDQLKELENYSACDIADALLKLNVPGAGFLPDILPFNPSAAPIKLVARASTVLFLARSTPSFPTSGSHNPLSLLNDALSQVPPNIEGGTPYSDLTEPETIAVLSQPQGQTCAVVGGIMAIRMAKMGVKAVLVDGRVRDLTSLSECGIPIWSRGTSIIGAGAETKAWATNVPVHIGNSIVEPGDIIMMDSTERGAVCIPRTMLTTVLEMVPKLVAADTKVVEDVERGSTVAEAFKKHRGK